jgi:hypothetical protein
MRSQAKEVTRPHTNKKTTKKTKKTKKTHKKNKKKNFFKLINYDLGIIL